MAVLPVIVAPDPRLKVKCEPVGQVDETIRTLMDDLLESMHAANGIGLSAPQVGVHKRVIVVNVPAEGETRTTLHMADPRIVWHSDEKASNDEGCLSLPEHFAEVTRPERVRVRFLDRHNEPREIEIDDLLATCVQHEMDHLDGILFVDHLSMLKRNIILRKLIKTKKAKENGDV